MNEDNCIKVWAWKDAPEELAVLSNGDDVDWVAVLPPAYAGRYISWMDEGSPFGCCTVYVYEHPALAGYEVRIGTHA